MSCDSVVSHDTTLECLIGIHRSGICMSCYHVAMSTCRVPLIDVSLFRSSRVYKCFVNPCLFVCLFLPITLSFCPQYAASHYCCVFKLLILVSQQS